MTSQAMTSYAIHKIEGMKEEHVQALEKAGVSTTEALLLRGKDVKGRKELAAETGISDALVLKWLNTADLMRIHGVGEEYSELLEAAGVDTVKELRHRNVENLTKALAAANEKSHLVHALPSEKVVAKWIEHAKELPPILTY